jgi:hypothetical protein
MESYAPNEYPSLDKTPRVPFLGGSLDAVLLDSDDEDAVDKLSTALYSPNCETNTIIIISLLNNNSSSFIVHLIMRYVLILSIICRRRIH